ncbi:MAG: PilZ domain-containing protein [Candidatus Omnitrophota bacterium]
MLVNDKEKDLKTFNQKESSPQSSDRRYLPRWEVSSKVSCQREGQDAADDCLSKDITAMGMCVSTSQALKSGEKLSLRMYLCEDAEPIRANGHVVWITTEGQDQRAGISFDWIDHKARDLIFNYAFQFKREELRKRWFKGC